MWKAEFVNDRLGYLAKKISKQNVEGAAQFLLAAKNKLQEKEHKSREELLDKYTFPNLHHQYLPFF